jgi:outer membrane protein OmpA-like peptidoglycan-associated protein
VVPYRTGHELVTGVAAEFALDYAARLWVGSELEAHSAFTNGAELFDPRSSRGVWLASVSWRVRGSPLRLTVALGPGFGEGAGAGAWHALGRVAWAPVVEPPAPDADDDGVPDAEDACRELAGAASGDPVMHGCPDLPKDEDGDGIPSELDACPREAGLPSAVPKRHGCPAAGAPESAPPPEAAPVAKPLAEVEAERIVIHQQVQFETGTSALRAESAEVLGQVAEILRAHPEITRVEVQGHTDEVGTREFNQRLSAGRAHAVVHWLVQHGVADERLVARGYGSDVPLATNATEQGRRTNRRVEFRILERADPTAAEPGTPESEVSP